MSLMPSSTDVLMVPPMVRRQDAEWFLDNPGSTAASKPIREAVEAALAQGPVSDIDRAIEAAAEARFLNEELERRVRGGKDYEPEFPTWESMDDGRKQDYESDVADEVEAAAPFLTGPAFQQGREAGKQEAREIVQGEVGSQRSEAAECREQRDFRAAGEAEFAAGMMERLLAALGSEGEGELQVDPNTSKDLEQDKGCPVAGCENGHVWAGQEGDQSYVGVCSECSAPAPDDGQEAVRANAALGAGDAWRKGYQAAKDEAAAIAAMGPQDGQVSVNRDVRDLDRRDTFDPDRILATVKEHAEDGARVDIATVAMGSDYRALYALYVDALAAAMGGGQVTLDDLKLAVGWGTSISLKPDMVDLWAHEKEAHARLRSVIEEDGNDE